MTREATEKDLREAIASAVQLLEAVGEAYWSSQLRRIDRDGIDVEVVLSLFGGMGSFNDLVIAAVNGHEVRGHVEDEKNRRLGELRERIHAIARAMRG